MSHIGIGGWETSRWGEYIAGGWLAWVGGRVVGLASGGGGGRLAWGEALGFS